MCNLFQFYLLSSIEFYQQKPSKVCLWYDKAYPLGTSLCARQNKWESCEIYTFNEIFIVIATELFFVKVIMIFIISPFSFYNFSFICLQFNLKDNNVSRIQNQNCKEILLEFAIIFILMTNHLTYSYI